MLRIVSRRERRGDNCNIADLIKPATLGSCMLLENVSKYAGTGPLFYSLKDSKGAVLREGKTGRKLSARINEYTKESWFPQVSQVCIQPFSDNKQLGEYEKARIGCDCPPYNKQLKSSCPLDNARAL
jgi:hypothetical protein